MTRKVLASRFWRLIGKKTWKILRAPIKVAWRIFILSPLLCFLIFVSLFLGIRWGYFYFRLHQIGTQQVFPIVETTNSGKREVLFSQSPAKKWLPLKNISSHVRSAVVVSEDWAFYEHQGIDYQQLNLAIHQAIKLKKKWRGASTITQQLAKNLFLSFDRNVFRKFEEAFLALMIEKVLNKQQILESYLNIIELGPKIYGVEQASRFYFKKSAAHLNPLEAAYFAALLPSPVRYSQANYFRKTVTPFMRKAILSILRKMRQAGHLGHRSLAPVIGRSLFAGYSHTAIVSDHFVYGYRPPKPAEPVIEQKSISSPDENEDYLQIQQ